MQADHITRMPVADGWQKPGLVFRGSVSGLTWVRVTLSCFSSGLTAVPAATTARARAVTALSGPRAPHAGQELAAGSSGVCHRENELPPGVPGLEVAHGAGCLVQRSGSFS